MSSKQGAPPPSLASNEDAVGTPMAAAAGPQLNPTPWISFSGAPNESGASFVQSVQRIAFMQNRIEDDKWIAQYASTCFTDSAMVWYLGLEKDTRSSWEALRLALVQRYPVPPPKPTAPAPPKATSPAITEIGRIEVLQPEFGDVFGYLSQDSMGKFVVNPSQEKALKLKAVLHTNSKNQHEKIYSLKLLDAPDSEYPFLGLRLVKFTEEDPDVVPEQLFKASIQWGYHVRDVPSCCKVLVPKRERNSGQRTSAYATWDFTEATESGPGPYYMRKAEGSDTKARVVSAVWNLLNPSKDVTELRLTWPRGDDRQGNVISEIRIDPVLHNGGTASLHAHVYDFTRTQKNNLDESHVVFLFKPIPNS